jgi:hypothetical protein
MSALVAIHEDIHDRILTTTAYGFVQRCFGSYFQPQVPRRWRQFAERWLAALDEESARLHEIAATHLSIKDLPQEQHAHALSGLHPAYREYYLVLANVIDAHAQSSFVQFVIAETIVNCALHSPLLIRAARFTGTETPHIGAEESPNQRFCRLLTLLDGDACSQLVTSLRPVLAAAAASRDLSSFDANSEDDWLNLANEDALGVVHHTLIEHVAGWFADRDQSGIPMPEENTIGDAGLKFVESAVRRNVIVSEGAFLDGFHLGDDVMLRNVNSAANSVFFNTPTVTTSDVPRLPRQVPWIVPTHPPATIAVSAQARWLEQLAPLIGLFACVVALESARRSLSRHGNWLAS